MGLSEKSRRWIRFPGFYFTRATLRAAIKNDFIFFDFGWYNRPSWVLFYSEHGRIWGAASTWEGDTPDTFERLDAILSAGNFCHTSGHPIFWFDYGGDSAYNEIHNIFSRIEEKYPHMGYLFPDEMAAFSNETYEIHDIRSDIEHHEYIFSFDGETGLGETVVVEWPESIDFPQFHSFDGLKYGIDDISENKILIVLCGIKI